MSDRGQTMHGFMNQALCDGVLDTRTKELIALGMAITARCSSCIGIHVNKALHPMPRASRCARWRS